MKKLILLITLITLLFSEEKTKTYKTTAYDSRLLQNPNSNELILRIPKDTKLEIIEMKTVQQGMMKNNWYKVIYKKKTGWISGFNMKEGEKVVITSIEEMEKNYEKQIGVKPKQNIFTNKVKIIDEYLKDNVPNPKSIKYHKWHPCVLLDGGWVCRVEYTIKDVGKMDKVFKISNSTIIDVGDK